MKNRTPFVYVYIVYYYDIDAETRFDRLHQCQPIPCASLKRAAGFVQPKIEVNQLTEINRGQMWRHGNYWIERQPIIDSYDEGLEREAFNSGETFPNLKLE